MSSPDPTTTEWVPIWSPITVGPQGPPGPPGITSPHQATHQIGNTDVLVNNAWTNQSNTFTQDQNITSAVPHLDFNDTNQPANSRKFSALNFNQTFTIQAMDDAGITGFGYLLLNRLGSLTVLGDITEKARSVPMGHWTWGDAGTYSHLGMTGPIGWSLVGKTFNLVMRASGNIPAGNVVSRFNWPAGVTVATTLNLPCAIYMAGITNAWIYGDAYLPASATYFDVYYTGSAMWPVGSAIISLSFAVPIL